MKLGRKGFMMAEVVVVSVVVVVVLVTIFTGLNRVSSLYETRNRYYDIDSEYMAIEANKALIRNSVINTLIKNGDSVKINNADVNKVAGNYENASLYFSLYNEDKVKSITDKETFKETLKEYATYLSTSLDYSEDYTYLIISEICKTEDDCYYYALKVR